MATHFTEHADKAMYGHMAIYPFLVFFERGLATVASIVSDGCGLISITACVYIM